MKALEVDQQTERLLLQAQRNEITEHFVYQRLLRSTNDPHTQEILERASKDEFRHYEFWRQHTLKDMRPSRVVIAKYYLLSRLFGVTFALKLMEKGEHNAQGVYETISRTLPVAIEVAREEEEHENELIGLIDEERLRYVGSMVLGLNDALVELTGVLAGLTFALQNTRLVAMAGSITGFAASLSMASSEYLSTKSEAAGKDPIKASVYTGLAYVTTVVLLILPFLLLADLYVCLVWSILNAIAVIFGFTYYVSVAKDVPFKRRFLEMAAVSLGIAALSFLVGLIIRMLLGIET
jgi:VIT1/CCC1 family predicted Fe2+/Mn2+ transporter